MFKSLTLILATVTLLAGCSETPSLKSAVMKTSLKIASFNVSMDATNYGKAEDAPWSNDILKQKLLIGQNSQIQNIAEILQRTRPDIVLLNEFDYISDPAQGIERFINNYLKTSQNGALALDYPYYYLAASNTGEPTDFDLNNDGKKEQFRSDAYGFGFFPGHYAMVMLSKYPIDHADARTFQYFRWSDMPGALKPIDPATGKPWYNDEEWLKLRLSSKSHWDVPVQVNGKTLHVLASHPTPPVFDGPEDRNGSRNHDEIRFWTDYITPQHSGYIYDDKGGKGGLAANAAFVILGDQNASLEGNARPEGILALLNSPRVNSSFTPQSTGGQQNKADNPNGKHHTAFWGMRADYVLPSQAIKVLDGGVFWPTTTDPLYRLVEDRKASSDHRLVWLDVELPH